MAITYTPFEELFAPAYQLTYISTDGHIDVGPNTYSVFHAYTTSERQQIFQVCEKHLPWESTQEQEQWERTMYMYQFIIKSPPPFPYGEYPLSEDIIMAITYNLIINELGDGNYSISAEITDNIKLKTKTIVILSARFDTEEQKKNCWDSIKAAYLVAVAKPDNPMAILETEAKTYLEK